MAYKRDIDDLRGSPALTIIELLQKEGAGSATTIPTFRRRQRSQIRAADEARPAGNLDQYDCVLIVTDHSDYDYPVSSRNRNWWSILETPPKALKAIRSCVASLAADVEFPPILAIYSHNFGLGAAHRAIFRPNIYRLQTKTEPCSRLRLLCPSPLGSTLQAPFIAR